MNQIIEYESTIRINIPERIFYNFIGKTDIIFIFDNDTRLSNRIVQKKSQHLKRIF
jgi:hypothetical protein